MRAVTIDSDLATLFTFTPRKPPITPILEVCVCVSRLAGGERKGGTSSQEHHSWSAATTTQSAASSAGQ